VKVDEETIKLELNRFICEELLQNRDRKLGEDEAIVTGGLIDSFSLAQVGVHIEKAFGVYVPDSELTTVNCDTINRITDLVLRYASVPDSSP
jgi:acyl carrier protein